MPREMFPVASMLVSLYHVVPAAGDPDRSPAWSPAGRPTRSGMLAGAAGASCIVMLLGTALALMFSAANVFFRDFTSVVHDLTNIRAASACR